MSNLIKTKAIRYGNKTESDVNFWVERFGEKDAIFAFSANYGSGESTFQLRLVPDDYETIIKGMLQSNRDAAVLAIGKALATTFEPQDAKD
nr:hypothetical protein [Brucella anthropi]